MFFDGGVIRAVGTEPLPRFSDAPEIIDGRGKHVYPGLIAAYTQLGLTEIQSVRATIDASETGGVTPEVRAGGGGEPRFDADPRDADQRRADRRRLPDRRADPRAARA